MSTGIPAPRDDDPEEVSDKLSIAAAMWARGEAADAISWLRRAAASAADAEADDRALELAKAAADLSTAAPSAPAPTAATQPSTQTNARAAMGVTAPTGTKPANAPSAIPPSRPPTNAPPKPPPSRSPSGSASSSSMQAAQTPMAAGARTIASRPAPRPSAAPAPAGSGRLAPLPPLRPLGAASQLARPTGRSSSTMKATDGLTTGATPSSASMRAAQEATMPEPAESPLHDEIDHDQTSVMPAAQARELFQSAEREASPMREPEPTTATTAGDAGEASEADDEPHDEDDLRQTMRRDAEERTPVPGAHADGPPTMEPITADSPTRDPAQLPTLEAMRVRIYATEGGAWVVPDSPGARGGVAAILVAQENTGDLRSVFAKKRE